MLMKQLIFESFFEKKYAWILYPVVFVLLAFIIRSGTFLQSSYDWDENLYVLGARSILDGYLPYIKIWDHKPPGIFFLFAPVLFFFESPIMAIRVLSCLAIGMTAYFLCMIIYFSKKNGYISGLVCGLLYVLFTLNNGGCAANTEIFYLFFISFSLFLIIRNNFFASSNKTLNVTLIFAGISLGLAASINYLALLHGLVLVFYMILIELPSFSSWKSLGRVLAHQFSSILLLCVGPVIVFALMLFIYAVNGAIDDFFFANVAANKIYVDVGSQPLGIMEYVEIFGGQFAGHWLLWISVLLLPVVWRAGEDFTGREKVIIYLSLFWIVVGIVGVSVSRLFWSHYFLQLIPALCLIASIVISKMVSPVFHKSYYLGVACLIIISVGASYNFVKEYIKYSLDIFVKRYVYGYENYGDLAKQISSYLENNIHNGDYVYIVDYYPIIYDLTNAAIPTKYVFPPFLIGNSSKKIINVDSLFELNNILKLNPKYIVKKHERPDPQGTDDQFYSLLLSHIDKFYEFDRSFSGIDIYVSKNRS